MCPAACVHPVHILYPTAHFTWDLFHNTVHILYPCTGFLLHIIYISDCTFYVQTCSITLCTFYVQFSPCTRCLLHIFHLSSCWTPTLVSNTHCLASTTLQKKSKKIVESDNCLQNTVLHFFGRLPNLLFPKTCPAELLSDLLGLIWCSFAIGAATNAFPYFCTSFGLHSTLERFSPGREPEWSMK